MYCWVIVEPPPVAVDPLLGRVLDGSAKPLDGLPSPETGYRAPLITAPQNNGSLWGTTGRIEWLASDQADHYQVELAADGSIAVTDHARGIPVDTEPRTGLSGVEVVFTKLHAGGKFGNSSYNATGGLHGVGASVVNALSARLDVAVDRNGATWEMSFRRGVVGTFDGDGPDAPFTPGGGLRKGKRVAKTKTGTRVRYWPDRQIFLADADLSIGQLNDIHLRA